MSAQAEWLEGRFGQLQSWSPVSAISIFSSVFLRGLSTLLLNVLLDVMLHDSREDANDRIPHFSCCHEMKGPVTEGNREKRRPEECCSCKRAVRGEDPQAGNT